ncbi:EamA-like transporter family protein [Mariniphaga anaerophila]|uniref:EamA-like transporter family protein n=1 Tax=Mariniphaga anaerophila TaxID=1484053 RepID=A0A1M4VAH0_9BACT|nr:EamA family transporter [Mariniphaga anaerophila]SHE65986.1 EamA-like transporter family protein [Mariniphaga anaerophila]
MIFLAASIISSTAIYIIFRWAKNYSCPLQHLITINYLTATLLGFSLLMNFNLQAFSQSNSWFLHGIVLGILYIGMFFLIGKSSQKAGVTITTLANKLSLVFPVLFSIWWFHEPLTPQKQIGIALALIAVLLTIYKKGFRQTKTLWFYFPLFIFAGSGLIDILIKFVQATRLNEQHSAVFSTFVFLVAFIAGVVISFPKIRKTDFNRPTVLLGMLLGIVNFGSLYFILNALNKSQLESSMVFAVNNMSVVAMSALAGFFIFKENLNRTNLAGLILALISLFFLL